MSDKPTLINFTDKRQAREDAEVAACKADVIKDLERLLIAAHNGEINHLACMYETPYSTDFSFSGSPTNLFEFHFYIDSLMGNNYLAAYLSEEELYEDD